MIKRVKIIIKSITEMPISIQPILISISLKTIITTSKTNKIVAIKFLFHPLLFNQLKKKMKIMKNKSRIKINKIKRLLLKAIKFYKNLLPINN